MGRCFQLDQVFPIIVRIIDKQSVATRRFVQHAEIVRALLADPEGARLVEEARRRCPDRSVDWLAHNMVAWLGEKYTHGRSGYEGLLERTRSQPYGYRAPAAQH